MVSQFPAIIIGGPPHRGKSVLSSIVSDVLRTRRVPHYRYQATPDGDGKWYNSIEDRVLANRFRIKHSWDHYFEESVETILGNRPLPFLVDVGGNPTPSQQELFALATHAVLLGANESELQEWRAIVEQQGLIVLAEIHSRQTGHDAVWESGPPLMVQLTRLERRKLPTTATSAAWQSLIATIGKVIEPTGFTAWEYHWQQLDTDILPFHAEDWLAHRCGRTYWEPADLKALHQVLIHNGTLALFADYPPWVAPSVATYIDADLLCFDARFGWLPIPTLETDSEADNSPWLAHVQEGDGYTALRLTLRRPHLSPHSTFHGFLPQIQPRLPLVIDGQLPRWLFAAMARYYARRGHEVGIALPRDNRAVVINGTHMGDTIPWHPLPLL